MSEVIDLHYIIEEKDAVSWIFPLLPNCCS